MVHSWYKPRQPTQTTDHAEGSPVSEAVVTALGGRDNLTVKMPAQQTERFMAVILALACLPMGCSTVSVTSTRSEFEARDPRPSQYHVAILKDEVPERPHKVIGTVRAKVKLSPFRSNVWPDDRIVKRLITEARRLGGDALINLTTTPVQGGGVYFVPVPGGSVGQVNTAIWIASVIVWLD